MTSLLALKMSRKSNTLPSVISNDEGGFTRVPYKLRCSSPAQDIVIIAKCPAKQTSRENRFDLLKSDDEEEEEAIALSIKDNHLIPFVDINGKLLKASTNNFNDMSQNTFAKILDSLKNYTVIVGKDVVASRTLVVEHSVRKEMSPKTRIFFEHLFGYYKMVCDSGLPFPGFRCGPGGSVSHRRPFMAGRLRAYLKEYAKKQTEAKINGRVVVDLNISSPSMTLKDPIMSNHRPFCVNQSKHVHDDSQSTDDGTAISLIHPEVGRDRERGQVFPKHAIRKNHMLFPRFTVKQGILIALTCLLMGYCSTIEAHAYSKRITKISHHGSVRGGTRGRDSDYSSNRMNHQGEEELSISSDYAQIKHDTMDNNNRPALLKDGHDDPTDNIGIMNRRGSEQVHSLIFPSRQLVVNKTMTDANIQYAAYQWVMNNTAALAQFGNIASWDTSRVSNMNDVFGYYNSYAGVNGSYWASSFNADLSKWNTSRVTTTGWMFLYASSFNGDLSQWNTSLVTNMESMFWGAYAFNGNLSHWDTSRVQIMYGMFASDAPCEPYSFNGDISLWDTSRVTDMTWMFQCASSFNGDLSQWNTNQVSDLSWMFYAASSFNCGLSKWNTSQVTSIDGMFYGAYAFNSNLSHWDTSRVQSMYGTFASDPPCASYAFNGDLSRWGTSRVSDATGMFQCASSFNSDLSQWDTSQVSSMHGMFYKASTFNTDLSKWNTGHVKDMIIMFYKASSFNGSISKWDTSQVTSMGGMFYGATSFNQVLCWNISKVNFSDYDSVNYPMFFGSSGSLSPASCLLTKNPTKRPTRKPSAWPTAFPTMNPTVRPTKKPSAEPSVQLTIRPSAHPTMKPTVRSTKRPTANLSVLPTSKPSVLVTKKPSTIPTDTMKKPTAKLSVQPTSKHSERPTKKPSVLLMRMPSARPTTKPPKKPSVRPSKKPSVRLTKKPTKKASVRPTKKPSKNSVRPTKKPSKRPTKKPSKKPTKKPSKKPTKKPSKKPTKKPSPNRPTKKPTSRFSA